MIVRSQTSFLSQCYRFIVTWTFAGGLLFAAADGAAQEQPGPMPVEAAEIEAILNDQPPAPAVDPPAPRNIDLLTLVTRGGAFMIPIGLMSLLVVAIAVERLVTLRQRKIIPPRFDAKLQGLIEPLDQFNPGDAYELCASFPSPAARVFKAMLMRTGQPLADIERAATEAIEREADRYSSPMQWLHFAASATPLMGLLGTVWGMIMAFHESTTLTADRSRSEQLSEGIYTALVTTLAGLIVAIPAAMLALYLENRLSKLFHQLEQLTFNIAPALARFRGHQRMDSLGRMHPMTAPVPPPIDAVAGPLPETAPRSKSKNSDKTKQAS